MRAMIVLTALLCVASLYGADAVEVLGVAKVGDGSEIAKAWAASPSNIKHAGEQVQWLVQLKQKISDGHVETHGAMSVKDDKHISIMYRRGQGQFDWVEVGNAAESGRNPLGQVMAVIVAMMKRSNDPLSDEQEKKLRELVKAACRPDVEEAWEKVEATPQDKALAQTFADKVMGYIQQTENPANDPTKELLAILTPSQAKIFATLMAPQGGGSVSGPDGTISHSVVSIGGKTQLTCTIEGMACAEAMRQAVQMVNSTFKTKLSIPTIKGDLANAKLNIKVVIDDPEQALQKLASAVGAKIDDANGALTLVPAKN